MTEFTSAIGDDGRDRGSSNSGSKIVTIKVDGQSYEIPEYSTVEEILKIVGKDPKKYGLVRGTNKGGSAVVPKNNRRIQSKDGDIFVTDLSGDGGLLR